MVTGGNATVFINNMDAAIAFYTGLLGMELVSHYGDHWATVAAGDFTIGLHPKDVNQPDPGTHGAIMIGLNVDDLESARARLLAGGALDVGPLLTGSGGGFVHFSDPDGNALYVWKV